MRSIKMLMISAFTFLSLVVLAQQPTTHDQKNKKAKTSQVKYACPMHPEETADKPGKCSICKMGLTAIKQADKSYACPMHPEEKSDKPGKCSKCKMDLTEVKQPAKAFVCPMHEDINSDKPGKCSKCKMDLKEKKDEHAGHNH
jgi:Cu(I)/Ag(I) efflux system membrane fusion protein